MSDKAFVSKIYEDLLKLNNKKTSQLKSGQKIRMDTSLKMISRWQICTWRDAQHRMSSGKGKLKQGVTTTLPLGWLKSKTLTTPSGDKDMEQQEL